VGPTLDEVGNNLSEAEKELKKLNDTLSKNCPKLFKSLIEQLEVTGTSEGQGGEVEMRFRPDDPMAWYIAYNTGEGGPKQN